MKSSSVWTLAATATAFVLVMSVAIAVVAWTTVDVNWSVEAHRIEPLKSAAVRMAAVAPQASAMAAPPPWVIAACHRQVRGLVAQDAPHDSLAPSGASPGLLQGLDPQQQRDPRYRDAYARCLRSRGHAS
jgi:hypothetical protein